MINTKIIQYAQSMNSRHDCKIYIYALAEGILISVRSLQRSEGDVSDPIKCIYS